MRHRSLIALGAFVFIVSTRICEAQDDLWRFGFYWSLTADSYKPADVPWTKYTHISQFAILPAIDCRVDDSTYGAARIQDALARSAHANGVKLLVTLLQDKALTAMERCTDPEHLDAFVANLSDYVHRHDYDGIDIDWEYGVVPEQYDQLVRALRKAMPSSILTADVAVQQRDFIARVQENLDRVNLMNYDFHLTDYHGRKLSTSWHHAALRSTSSDGAVKSGQGNVEYLLKAKISASKINYGVPFYGYAISACRDGFEQAQKCTAPVSESSQRFSAQGPSISQLSYAQILRYFAPTGVKWDAEHGASYIQFQAPRRPPCKEAFCKNNSFITFSDPRAIESAVDYALAEGLGGIMTFALHQEYLENENGDLRYPLSSAMYSRIQQGGRL